MVQALFRALLSLLGDVRVVDGSLQAASTESIVRARNAMEVGSCIHVVGVLGAVVLADIAPVELLVKDLLGVFLRLLRGV